MFPYAGEGFALAAALCWAIGPLIAYRGVEALGTFRFSMFRFALSATSLFILAATLESLDFSNTRTVLLLTISGIVGIAFGEACLFQAVYFLGPRIASIIFSLHAPLTAFVGAAIFSETISAVALSGILLSLGGVYMAIFFRSQSEVSGGEWYKPSKNTGGLLLVGLAVIFQIIGALLSKEVMSNTSPFFASFLRTASVTVAFAPIFITLRERKRIVQFSDFKFVALSAFVSTIGGMTFLLAAFANTEIFRAVILASLSPVQYIIIMSIWRRENFPLGAWIGTFVTLVGVVMTIGSA